MLFIIHVYLIMCLYGLVNKLVSTQLLKDNSLKANHSKPVLAFWAPWTPCYICWVWHLLTLALYFSIIWIKIPDGYQLLEFGEIRLVINQSVVPIECGVFTWRSELSFHCLYSEVVFFILICYVISVVYGYYLYL